MISDTAFADGVRSLTDTAFAVSYLILGNSADCEDAMSEAILRAYQNRGKLLKSGGWSIRKRSRPSSVLIMRPGAIWC